MQGRGVPLGEVDHGWYRGLGYQSRKLLAFREAARQWFFAENRKTATKNGLADAGMLTIDHRTGGRVRSPHDREVFG